MFYNCSNSLQQGVILAGDNKTNVHEMVTFNFERITYLYNIYTLNFNN